MFRLKSEPSDAFAYNHLKNHNKFSKKIILKDGIRSNLKIKLRSQEREANAREDELRNEMEESRK